MSFDLIPFDPNPSCPKCGNKDCNLRYSSGYKANQLYTEDTPEFLNVECLRCGYKRRMETHPAGSSIVPVAV